MRPLMPVSALMLAALLCLSCKDSTPVAVLPDGSKYEAARTACVDRINAFRASENLKPLARWSGSEECADGEAMSDAGSGQAHGAFGTCGEWAQDECPGWGSVQSTVQGCLQSMWDERLTPGGQQGHYKNMSNTKYTQVACGFFETAGGKVWALQNFK
ncbi:MAG: hypothetical protein JWP91_3742 [Fibrobacteres bacterium]|nr:hypothetical protein [Fibrobacterota bacterium]